MRKIVGFKAAALLGGSIGGLLLSVTPVKAQVSNPNFELPADSASGTDTTAELGAGNTTSGGTPTYSSAGVANGWYLSPAVGDNYTNPGDRCQFDTPTPSGGTWSFWMQTFVQDGYTAQTVGSVTAGTSYTFSSQLGFQDGSAAGQGYNAVTLANQASDPKTMDTGDLYSYLGIIFLNNHGNVAGTLDANNLSDETDIAAGSVSVFNQSNGATIWLPYSVTGVAPAGATQAELVIGWQNGGLDGSTGGQSAFATAGAFGVTTVPEPATLSVLAIGAGALFMRRRSKTTV